MWLLRRKLRPSPINIFDFNHIDPTLDRGTVEMLKKFYTFYHKKHWGYDELFRAFQQKNLVCTVVVGKFIISSAVAGGITLNPVVICVLTGVGLGVKGVASLKKYNKKAEKANFAQVEYKKILDAIHFHLRGKAFNEKTFLDKLKMVDYFVSDHCMEIPEKIQAKYAKRFVAE